MLLSQGAPSRDVLSAASEARAQRPHGASLAAGGDGAGSQPVEEEREDGAQQGLPVRPLEAVLFLCYLFVWGVRTIPGPGCCTTRTLGDSS